MVNVAPGIRADAPRAPAIVLRRPCRARSDVACCRRAIRARPLRSSASLGRAVGMLDQAQMHLLGRELVVLGLRKQIAQHRSRSTPRAPPGRERNVRAGGSARPGATRPAAGWHPAGRTDSPGARCRRARERIRAAAALRRSSRGLELLPAAAQRVRPRLGDRTSTKRCSSEAGPAKLTQRLFSVRPASSPWPFLAPRSTSTRCTLPTMAAADRERLGIEQRLQPRQPLLLDLQRHLIGQRRPPACRAAAVEEAERLIELHIGHQLERGLEIALALAREADDDDRWRSRYPAARRAARGCAACTRAWCSRASSARGCGPSRSAPAGADDWRAAARWRRPRSGCR